MNPDPVSSTSTTPVAKSTTLVANQDDEHHDTFYMLVKSFKYSDFKYPETDEIPEKFKLADNQIYMDAITHELIGKYNGIKYVNETSDATKPPLKVYSFTSKNYGTRRADVDDKQYMHLLQIITQDYFLTIQRRSSKFPYNIGVNPSISQYMMQADSTDMRKTPFFFMKYEKGRDFLFQIIKITPDYISLITTSEGLIGNAHSKPVSFFNDIFFDERQLKSSIINYDVINASVYSKPTPIKDFFLGKTKTVTAGGRRRTRHRKGHSVKNKRRKTNRKRSNK